MLYSVSQGVQSMAATVIRNHPNAWDVQIVRKVVQRPEETGSMGGLPNFGGIGTLDSQDEVQYSYEFLCNAHALKAESFAPGNMTDRLHAPIGDSEGFLYMLQPARDAQSLSGDAIQLKTKDVVLFVLGAADDAARLAFEISSVDATCELPPFLPRYVLNRRADLDLPAGFDAEAGLEDAGSDDDQDGMDSDLQTPSPDAGAQESGNSVATPENDGAKPVDVSDFSSL